MASPRKGQFPRIVEWAKHLRWFGKKQFWHKDRATARNFIRKARRERLN
ncbi:MAG TPA: hypothetical protein VIY48_16065 [Candidatus Paceibacterota bacterium]